MMKIIVSSCANWPVSPERTVAARFVCALALCAPDDSVMSDWTVRESCEGLIAFELKGANGFGYDPLFFYPAVRQNLWRDRPRN